MCEKSLTKSVKFLFFTSLILLVNNLKAQIQADFSSDTTSGCGSVTVNFSNTSNVSGSAYNFEWDFGNGNSSILENPSATYSSAGSYDVRLIVSNTAGTERDTVLKTNYVTIFDPPNADFSFSPSGGCSPITVNFTNSSTAGDAPIISNRWVYADGSQPFFGNNASHTYQTAGDFRPSLEVIDQNGCRDFAVDDTVFVTASPIARVTTLNSRISCQSPHNVNFKSNSTGFNLTYKWYFGDGDSSLQENPSHTYNSLGRYDVSLIVSDPNCSDTLFLSEYVILENSVANFSLQKDTLCAGESFSPIDNSQGASIYSWNFGDGTQKNGKNISHTYQDSGYYEIRLTVSAGASCTDTYTDSVYVRKVTADFVTDSTFSCLLNDTVNFNYTGINGEKFIWKIGYKDSSKIYTTENNFLTYRQIGEGVFSDTLIAIDGFGCKDTLVKDSNRVVKIIEAKFLIDSTLPIVDTIGGCIPLTFEFTDASIGPGNINRWEWYMGEEDTLTNQNIGNYTFNDTVAYDVQLKVWNNLGCFSTFSKVFQGGRKQNPNFIFLSDSVCRGDTLFIKNLSTDTNLIEEYNYYLFPLGGAGEITSLNTISHGDVFFTNYQDTGAHIVSLEVFNNQCDTLTTSSQTIYVKGPISDVFSYSDCNNRNQVYFNGNIRGATRFYWNFGDSTSLDSINKNPSHLYDSTRAYRGTLTTYNDSNGCGGPFIDTFYVNLAQLPPLKIRPDTMEYCLFDETTFFYEDSLLYLSNWWIFDGDTLSNRPKFNIDFNKKGTFVLELLTLDFLGCYYSTKDTIFISKPEVNFEVEILEPCLPMEVIFKDSTISDTTLSSWRWTFGNNDTSYLPIDTVTYFNPGRKDIELRVENIYGCADSIVKEDYLSTSDFDVNFTQSKVIICKGDSVTFRNLSNGSNIDYQWIFGNDTIFSNNTTVTHTFNQADTFDIILVGINNLGCSIEERKIDALVVGDQPQAEFIADTLQSNCYPLDVNFTDLSSGGVNKWNWRFGDGNSSILQNPFNSYTSLGQFDVFLKVSNSAGCEDSTIKAKYIQTNGPAADIQLSKDSACINETVIFSIINRQNIADFEWDFGDGTTSKEEIASHAFQRTGTVYYTLSLFDSLRLCQVNIRDSIHIFEISAEFTVDEDTACQPHQATFTALSPGASQLSWNFGNGNTSNSPIETNTYQSPGLFTAQLIVNSPLGCKDTAQQNILVHPKPESKVHNDTTICYGDTIELWAKGGIIYNWNKEEFLLNNSNSTTLAWPDTSTTFMVEVLNEFNCIDTSFVNVEVQPPPLNNPLSYSDTSIIIGEYIDLNATAGDNLNYAWFPDEGLSCTTCPNPRAQPLKNTQYIVSISDPFGCFSFSDTLFIEVIEKYSLEVPNAFSPNGDGNNDIVYAKGWGLKKLLAFKIYNRFGELVFESNKFDHGWDGTYKGEPQNMETYVFTVEAETYSGKILSKKGNITLLK